jgi:hypothetical protein
MGYEHVPYTESGSEYPKDNSSMYKYNSKNKIERMNTHANDRQRPTMISAAHMLATGRFRRACLPVNEAESRAGRTVTAGRRVKKKKKAFRTACAWESDMLSGGFADDGANWEQIARARPSKVPY